MLSRTNALLIAAFITTVAAVPIVAATHDSSDGDKVAFSSDRGGFGVDDPDAECFVNVAPGGVQTCSDGWKQQAGEFGGDWHTTFHPDTLGFVDSSVGRLELDIRDDTGAVVFERECVWFGPASLSGTGGLCAIDYNAGDHSVGEPGNWTMVFTARLDAGLSTEAHAQFGLHSPS